MKKYLFLALFGLVGTPTNAQNLDIFGISGNPLSLDQNPAAKTDLRFHLSLPGLTTQGNLTTPLSSLWGDVGQKLYLLEAPNIGLASATDIDLVGFGFKRKKGYTWVQTGINVDARFHLDKDLVILGLYGMKDANGVLNPNYTGSFDHSGLGLSAMAHASLGHQRAINEKLRMGAAVQVNRLLGGFEWNVNQWSLVSHFNPGTQTNELTWESSMELSAYGLISDAALLDSVQDFPRYLIMGMVPEYLNLLKQQKDSYTLNLGVTYTPNKRLTLTASSTGLPLSLGSASEGIVNSRSLQWLSNLTYSGFSTGFSPQDTGTWSYYLTNLQSQAVDDFYIKSAPSTRFSAPFTVHAAGYFALLKNHKVGIHCAHVDRLAVQHQSLGFEYQGFFGRNLQVATSYRLHRWEGVDGASELSTIVQNRILPWTTLYVGTNLWLSSPAIQNGGILLPGNFQSWQVTAGLNFTLFEKRFKEERRERREAKKASRSTPKEVSKEVALTMDDDKTEIHKESDWSLTEEANTNHDNVSSTNIVNTSDMGSFELEVNTVTPEDVALFALSPTSAPPVFNVGDPHLLSSRDTFNVQESYITLNELRKSTRYLLIFSTYPKYEASNVFKDRVKQEFRDVQILNAVLPGLDVAVQPPHYHVIVQYSIDPSPTMTVIKSNWEEAVLYPLADIESLKS